METLYKITSLRRQAVIAMIKGQTAEVTDAHAQAAALLAETAADARFRTSCEFELERIGDALAALNGKLPWCVSLKEDADGFYVKVHLDGRYFCTHCLMRDAEVALLNAVALWDGLVCELNRARITTAVYGQSLSA